MILSNKKRFLDFWEPFFYGCLGIVFQKIKNYESSNCLYFNLLLFISNEL